MVKGSVFIGAPCGDTSRVSHALPRPARFSSEFHDRTRGGWVTLAASPVSLVKHKHKRYFKISSGSH